MQNIGQSGGDKPVTLLTHLKDAVCDALGRPRQEDPGPAGSLGYIQRLCLKSIIKTRFRSKLLKCSKHPSRLYARIQLLFQAEATPRH